MTYVLRAFVALLFSFAAISGYSQTTSWRGTSSTAWATAANWTNGVPSATVDAVVGDASYTGTFQPSITATANSRSLTLGGGARNIQLTVNALLNVATNVDIRVRGTLRHTANSISLKGNWSNTGTYTPTVNAATVVFSGTTQSINSPTSFRRLTVNAGSTTSLNADITVTNAFVVSGTFDPTATTNLVTLTGSTFTVNASGRIRVFAALFSGNYSLNPTTLNATSIVEYASASVNQTIATISYGTLTISGGSLKTLAANTTLLSSSNAAGRVNVNAGTLDLGTFTLNRAAAGGGIFTIVNGATLIIGGTNTFPANYTTTTLGATSTVIYNGNNQAVTAKTYGHLTLSGTTGAVTKTFPATAMTIAGNLTSTVGTATSVAFSAGAVFTINGNVSIGASTTFNGGSATHVMAGNWANAGTFNGNTGTVRFNGATRVISGAGTQGFNNITVAGSGVTCSSTNLTLTGNLATTGAGTFTHNAGGTTTFSGASKTIGGTGISLPNLVISGSVSTTASFAIGGNMTTSGTFNATAGTITFGGAPSVITNTGTTTFFALSVAGSINTSVNFSVRSNITGAGKITATAGTISFTGTSTVSGTHDFFNITVNGTRLQLGANATVSVAGAMTISSGTFNTTTTTPNTFIYNGPGNQNITAGTYNNLVLANGGTKTAVGATTSSSLTINSGVTFNAATFTHTISGNWINNGTFVPSTSTVTFNGAVNGSITGATTFNILTHNKGTAATTVTLNNSINVTTLNMTQGRMLTGANSVTITGTRTGNAVILGNITRTHAFAVNTAYAFESSFNTITFTNITSGSVTSVTVNVTSAPVADFPSSNSINRAYDISVTKTGTYLATLRLHYDDTELNGNVEASLNVWRFQAGTWTGVARNSNNTTNNWVQQNGFADVTGRWTLFDGSANQVWKGTTSTAWATAGNWKSGVVPAVTDNISIGTETFTNQPTITTAVTAKAILFGSVKAVALTIGGGSGSLTVNGNLTGDWTADQTHSVAVGARSLTVGGDLTLCNGNPARSMQLTVSTGTTSVAGSVIQTGAGSISFSGAGSLIIGTDYNYTSGTFVAGTGTVMYNGSVDQVIAGGLSYNNLVISKPSGTASLSNATTVNGSVMVSGANVVNINATLDVAGSVTISSGTTLNSNNATVRVGGAWNRLGAFNGDGGVVVFNGAGSQTITQTTFNDLVINKTAGTVTPGNDLVVNGDLSVNSGTFDIGTFNVNRSASGGTLTVGNGATLRVGGSSNFPTNYDIRTLGSNSTVIFNGTTAQTVPAATYGHLQFSNGGAAAKALTADTQVNGDLTISAGSTLDGGQFVLSLQGSWTNAGTFASTSGTVELLGSGKSISGPTTFNAVDIIGSYTAAAGTALMINGTAALSGTLNVGTNSVTLGGDVIVDGTLTTNGSVIFTGTQAQTLEFNGILSSPSLSNTMIFNGSVAPILNSAVAPTFTHVTVNNTGGVTASQPWTVVGNFTVNAGGRWNGAELDHTFRGQFNNTGVIAGEGKFTIAPGLPLVSTPTTIGLGSGANFQNTGTVEFGGINALAINGAPSVFNDVIFSNTSVGGMTIGGNLNVGGDMTINAGATFHGGTGLTHTINSNLLVDGVLNGNTSTFLLNPTTTAQVGGSGSINFYDIRFDGSVEATSDFNVQRNLINNGSFVPDAATVNFTGSTAGAISGSAGTTSFNNISVNKPSSTLSLNGNIDNVRSLTITSGTMALNGFMVSENSGVGGSLGMDANTRLTIGSVNTMPVFSLGYTLDPASTVEYNGSTQAIAPMVYGHVALSNPGVKSFNASLPTEMTDLTNGTSALLPASATLRLNGHWINNGSFSIGTNSTINFKGAATQTISGSSVTDFVNVSITNTASPGVAVESNQNLRGVMTLASNATVDADGTANTSILRVMSSADDPTQDASIATLPSGAAVVGNVTVQRYMSIEGASGGRIYRYISSPVQNASVADLQNEIPVSGAFTGRSVCSGCTTSWSLFSYDETVTTGGIDGGYVGFPVLANTEMFQPGRGYATFVRGNLISTALWDVRGPINSGLINLPVSFTSSGTLTNDGWNLVGNPYPATIDWNAATGWTKTNINATVYIHDNAIAGGQYATWNGVVGTNGGSRYIAAGQGFWVKSGSASPALSVNEDAKVAGTQTSFFREGAPDNLARITLSQGDIRDEAIVHFRTDATNTFDPEADAIKLLNAGFSLSTQLPGQDKLTINSLSASFCSTSVYLVLDNVTAGSYKLAFDNLDTFGSYVTATLTDAFLGTTTNVVTNNSYTFSVTADAASKALTRFSLAFARQTEPMNFSVTTTKACPGSNAVVDLSNTFDLITYQVAVNGYVVFEEHGNNGTISVTIPVNVLSDGNNSVVVRATPFNTCQAPVEKTAVLVVESVSAPNALASADICREGKTILTATGASASEQYHWYANPGDTTPSGVGDSFITATLTESKVYYVSIASSAGCESARIPVTATVVHFDDPLITLNDHLLIVDYPGSKQWYFNGDLISGATSSSIEPIHAGDYSVAIPVGSCVARASYTYSGEAGGGPFLIAGVEANSNASIKVYPNPVINTLYFQQERSVVADVLVKDLSGRTVGAFKLSRQGPRTTGQFDMSPVAAGFYFVEVQLADETHRVKILKQ